MPPIPIDQHCLIASLMIIRAEFDTMEIEVRLEERPKSRNFESPWNCNSCTP
jgi:hypothetical protein